MVAVCGRGSERGSSRGWPWETEVCEVDFMGKNFPDKGSIICRVLLFIPNPVPYFLTLASDTFCPTWLYICYENSLNRFRL